MGIIYFVVIALAVPVLLFVLGWAGAAVYRLFFQKTRTLSAEASLVVRRATPVLVGAREIRQEQREYYSGQAPAPYNYAYGQSEGFPKNWHEDLWRRRN